MPTIGCSPCIPMPVRCGRAPRVVLHLTMPMSMCCCCCRLLWTSALPSTPLLKAFRETICGSQPAHAGRRPVIVRPLPYYGSPDREPVGFDDDDDDDDGQTVFCRFLTAHAFFLTAPFMFSLLPESFCFSGFLLMFGFQHAAHIRVSHTSSYLAGCSARAKQ